ncbi:hypothetical protein GCM10022245_04480 [Streptomyces mayteni]
MRGPPKVICTARNAACHPCSAALTAGEIRPPLQRWTRPRHPQLGAAGLACWRSEAVKPAYVSGNSPRSSADGGGTGAAGSTAGSEMGADFDAGWRAEGPTRFAAEGRNESAVNGSSVLSLMRSPPVPP